MANALELHLQSLITAGCKSIQVGLRGSQPIGPGRVERIDVPLTVPENGQQVTGTLYKILVDAMIGTPSSIPGMQPQLTQVVLPMVFSPAEIVWLSEGPLDAEGNPIVTTVAPPPSNGRGRSGLTIG